jgi:hypothetical protein
LQNERVALGYVGSQLVATALIMIGVTLRLLLLALSREYLKSGSPEASHFQTIGDLIRTSRDLENHVGMILVLSIGSLLFYTLLYQVRLVPRGLTVWGLLGTAVAIVSSVLFMSRLIDLTTAVFLSIPLALQELVFALWLIPKGFTSHLKNENDAQKWRSRATVLLIFVGAGSEPALTNTIFEVFSN